MTRVERRRTMRTLGESAAFLACIVVAVGLPGWVEYICVNFMVLRDFDQRDAQVSGTVSDNPAFRRLINQLKPS